MNKPVIKRVAVIMYSTRYVNVVNVGLFKANYGEGLAYEL